ncbi:MAG: hypothetical protein FWE93_02315 [Alphaproteobacteria bacterium]|nr:hypothetical protein [Alphaproteobacteria bacterium]
MDFNNIGRSISFELDFQIKFINSLLKCHQFLTHSIGFKTFANGINDLLDSFVGNNQFFFTGIMPSVEFSPNLGTFFVIGFHKTRKGFFGKQASF